MRRRGARCIGRGYRKSGRSAQRGLDERRARGEPAQAVLQLRAARAAVAGGRSDRARRAPPRSRRARRRWYGPRRRDDSIRASDGEHEREAPQERSRRSHAGTTRHERAPCSGFCDRSSTTSLRNARIALTVLRSHASFALRARVGRHRRAAGDGRRCAHHARRSFPALIRSSRSSRSARAARCLLPAQAQAAHRQGRSPARGRRSR